MQGERIGIDITIEISCFKVTYMNWSVLYHFETRTEIKGEILAIKGVTEECI